MVVYRSRLGGDLGGATLDYLSSVDEDLRIVGYDVAGSQAHVVMLHDAGVIQAPDARAILAALEEVKAEGVRAGGGGGGGPEDIHELVEAAVIEKAGPASGGRMHTARSRNDQVALDMRMKIRDDTNELCGLLLDAAGALVSVAQKHSRTAMPLYTHLQQAQAGTLSHYLLAHADALLRDFGRLSDGYRRANLSPLGAGPVGGTSIPIDRDSTAAMLGFGGLAENSVDATGARDFAAEFVCGAAIAMTNLSRLAEDIVIWSTAEFSFVELSDEFASPSSVMPQKKNPDVMELTRGKAAQVIGELTGVMSASKGLATGYGRDLQQIKPQVWSASRTLAQALAVVRQVVLTLKVNEGRMGDAADSGYLVALDIAERLVKEGVAFRTAHRVVGGLVRKAHQGRRRLSELTPGEVSALAGEGGDGVDPVLLREIAGSATVQSSLRERVSRGSSGYAEQERMIALRTEQIASCRRQVEERSGAVRRAIGGLQSRVDGLIAGGRG